MKKIIAIIVVTIVLLFGLSFVLNKQAENKPTPEKSLAMCLTEKGVKFYGAFWCPHCQDQKTAFKNGKKQLPYVECSTASREQTQICKDEKIESYPTWKFPNGETMNGAVALSTLAAKSGCTFTGIDDSIPVKNESPVASPAGSASIVPSDTSINVGASETNSTIVKLQP